MRYKVQVSTYGFTDISEAALWGVYYKKKCNNDEVWAPAGKDSWKDQMKIRKFAGHAGKDWLCV